MFGGGTNIFGSQPQSGGGGLFGSPQQQQQGGLSTGGALGGTSSSLFGVAQNAVSTPLFKTPQTSLFSTPNATTGFATAGPSTSAYGTAMGGGSGLSGGLTGSSFLQQQQQNFIPPEVLSVLGNLSNADMRSCQVLTDIFNRLKQLSIDKSTPLVSFTYEAEFDSNSLNQKRTALEQQLAQLNHSGIIEAYTMARRKNPDPSIYGIVPLNNFDGIVKRAETQNNHIGRINTILIEFKSRQERIGNHMKITTFKRLEDITKRQRCLQSSLFRVVGLLEEYAIRTSRAQFDIVFLRRLQSDLANVSDELHSSSAGRPKLNEVAGKLARLAEHVGVDIRTFRKKRTEEKPAAELTTRGLSERDFKVIVRIIQKQQALFESLGTVLHQDLTKVKRLIHLSEGGSISTSGFSQTTKDLFVTPNSSAVTSTPKRPF